MQYKYYKTRSLKHSLSLPLNKHKEKKFRIFDNIVQNITVPINHVRNIRGDSHNMAHLKQKLKLIYKNIKSSLDVTMNNNWYKVWNGKQHFKIQLFS